MKRLAALWQGLSTVLAREGVPGARAHGVLVPYAYPDSLAPLGEDEVLDWLAARMRRERAGYLGVLAGAAAYRDRFESWRHADPQDVSRPRFDQLWFSGLDAAMAYTMVRSHAPARIVEVGSGHSTRFLARAVADAGLATCLHSIDPVPRRDIDSLCQQVTRESVTRVGAAPFRELGPGDLLFIDGSHSLLPGSDVEHLLTRVLPELATGVLVHVHDVFLPWGYPRHWTRRAYTEQSVIAAMLGAGDRYRVLCPNAWLRRSEPEAVAAVGAHLQAGALESSLWLEVAQSAGG